MLRVIFLLGLIVVAGLMILGLLFGIAGALIWFLIRVLVIGGVVYLIIRIVNPSLAASIRTKLGG